MAQPAAIFILLSALFGTLVIILTPPLRGPDEPAHFLRAYGIARGDLIPSTVDPQGRRGIFLPFRVQRDFAFFASVRYKIGEAGLGYPAVRDEYARQHVAPSTEIEGPPVFVLYEGSESYAPVVYWPYAAAALVARLADLDFVHTLYLMRFVGFAAMTAVAAYAVAIVPHLKWTFLGIAMLPAALYGRAVVSADGGALAYVMMMTALCIRSMRFPAAASPWEHSLWMTLCVLSKPPQLAFILLETIRCPLRSLPRHWRSLSLIIVPCVVLSFLWLAENSGNVAAWRIIERYGLPPEQFDLTWKIRFMWTNPLHFPRVLVASFGNIVELWRQLIGVLGWLDTPLRPWVYPVVSTAVFATCLTRLELDRSARRRIAIVAGLTVLGYCLAVYLIFFLAWTPIDWGRIEGVQGRYFIVCIPPAALVVAALINRGPTYDVIRFIAVCSAILGGAATIEALLRVDWKLL